MPRIRSVHPGLFTDEAFVQVSEAAQILAIGIWTQCDDAGIFEWKPVQLRMCLRPTKDGAVDPLLAELEAVDMIRGFEVDGRKYGAVRNFCRWQRPKKPKYSHPTPPELRTYVALGSRSSELDEDDELPLSAPRQSSNGVSSEPGLVSGTGSTENPPQREEGGGRRLEGESKAKAFDSARGPPKSQKRAKSSQKTAFPSDFALSEVGAKYAASCGFSPLEAARMFERFKNHHTAKGSVFADWEAAWRTWVGNQLEFNQARQAPVAAKATWDPGI